MSRTDKIIYIVIASVVGIILIGLVVWMYCLPVFDMTVKIPRYPENIQILKIIKTDILADTVAEIGSKLGMKGKIEDAGDSYTMSNNETGAFLSVHKTTGAIDYYILSKLRPDKSPVLPSSEDAASIAMKFLAERNWLAEGMAVNRVEKGLTSSDGKPANLSITFDLPVKTFSTLKNICIVTIGDGGEVISLFYNPGRYEPVKTTSLKPVQEAYKELKETGRRYSGIGIPWISINDVSVEYWPVDINKEFFLYPVYVFRGKCLPGDEVYTGWIDATSEYSFDFLVAE